MKTYWMRFGSGDPRTYTGLNPTFLIFSTSTDPVTPPGITEFPASSGLYYFNWGTTTSISFLADAATTSPGTAGRYVAGAIDPADRADEYGNTLVAIGTTNFALGTTGIATTTNLGVTLVGYGNTGVALGTTGVAIGTTLLGYAATLLAQGITVSAIISGIGSTASSFGTDSADPVDLFGYLKRVIENLEGNQTYTKGSGGYLIYSRGSSTLLRTKTITNSVTMVVKT